MSTQNALPQALNQTIVSLQGDVSCLHYSSHLSFMYTEITPFYYKVNYIYCLSVQILNVNFIH